MVANQPDEGMYVVGSRRERLIDRRKTVGLSQERLAEVVGVETSTVARWERGETDPQPVYRPRLAEALKLTPEAVEALLADTLGVPEDVPADTPSARIHSKPPTDVAAEELRERLLNAAAVDKDTLALLAAQAEHIRDIDRHLGARAAQAQMNGHLAALGHLRGFGISPNQREPLACLYADAATLAGWQCVDLGELDQAWRHYEAAKDAAREGNPPAALVHAMAEQAYVLVEAGEPVSALQLAEHARSLAGTAVPPLLLAWLEAVVGELHAATGDDTSSRRAFDSAERLLPDDLRDPKLPYVILSDVHLARWRGNARATLGDPLATDDLRQAVYGIDASFTRARAGLHVDLAAALLAARLHCEALAEVGQAKTLASRVGSARQRRRIRHLESRLHAA